MPQPGGGATWLPAMGLHVWQAVPQRPGSEGDEAGNCGYFVPGGARIETQMRDVNRGSSGRLLGAALAFCSTQDSSAPAGLAIDYIHNPGTPDVTCEDATSRVLIM
jgi:hypothetical protein